MDRGAPPIRDPGTAKLEQRLAELRSELLTAIAELRRELVCWMFGFWVSTLLGIAVLLIALGHR